jgi:transketolase N-terminal domain/subunit
VRAAVLPVAEQGPGPRGLLHRVGRDRSDATHLGSGRAGYVTGLTDGGTERAPPGRQYFLLGDATLHEGAVWEAVLDPQVATLGEVVWLVDMNRQSLTA